MFTVPTEIPVTTPELATVATLVFPEDHVPPVIAFNNVIELPRQTVPGPELAASGLASMVITRATEQPNLV